MPLGGAKRSNPSPGAQDYRAGGSYVGICLGLYFIVQLAFS